MLPDAGAPPREAHTAGGRPYAVLGERRFARVNLALDRVEIAEARRLRALIGGLARRQNPPPRAA